MTFKNYRKKKQKDRERALRDGVAEIMNKLPSIDRVFEEYQKVKPKDVGSVSCEDIANGLKNISDRLGVNNE